MLSEGKGHIKNIYFIVSIGLLFSIFIIFRSFGQQEAIWKGTIEKAESVTVVKNPNEPLYGEITFDLKEDLSIGSEEDENYMFYSLVGTAVDSKDNIFVLDEGECRIQKFDKKGTYLQTIGKRGQGPGEFEQPLGIFLDAEDMIYVRDSLRRNIHVFGKDGKYAKTIHSPGSVSAYFGITKEKNILTIQSLRSSEEIKREIVLIDAEGNILKSIASYPDQSPRAIKGHILGNPYSHRLHLFPAKEGGGIYGHSSQYKLFVLNSSGDLSHIIEVNKQPEPITGKEKNDLVNSYLKRRERFPVGEKLTRGEVTRAYIFPDHKPYFIGIIGDDSGRIYVRMFKTYDPNDKSESFDVFSRDGYYIYKANIPVFPNTIKNGYVYAVDHDLETGYIKIKRYRIRNWEEINK